VSILASLSDDIPWLSGEAGVSGAEFLWTGAVSGPVHENRIITESRVKRVFFILSMVNGLTVRRVDGSRVRFNDSPFVGGQGDVIPAMDPTSTIHWLFIL
jgi:hypothetical protein